MINLNPEARMNILLGSNNRALADVIKNATPEQLKTLSDGKDIKSLLQSFFSDTINSTKSNQVLLELIKNTPNFKLLGEFNGNLRSLIDELKQDNIPTSLKDKLFVLEKFFNNIKNIDSKVLKEQLSSSGVFMESKIALALQKLPNILKTLDITNKALQNFTETKSLQNNIETMLKSPIIKDANLSENKAMQFSESIKNIAKDLQNFISQKNEPNYQKDIQSLNTKLITTLDTIKNSSLSLGQKELITNDIKIALSSFGATLAEDVALENMLNIKDDSPLQMVLMGVSSKDSSSLLDTLEKILKSTTMPSDSELQSLSQKLEEIIKQPTKELMVLHDRLQKYIEPKTFLLENLIKEELKDDIKVNMMKIKEDINLHTNPSLAKIAELSDKILTQIDYHQLLSHLNASSSVYFPFSWDLLEEGSFYIKKQNEDKFYCHIDLKLKEYGDLSLMLSLYDKTQLEFQALSQRDELTELIRQNLPELRSKLTMAGLTLRSMRVLSQNNLSKTLQDSYTTYFNPSTHFEVKI